MQSCWNNLNISYDGLLLTKQATNINLSIKQLLKAFLEVCQEILWNTCRCYQNTRCNEYVFVGNNTKLLKYVLWLGLIRYTCWTHQKFINGTKITFAGNNAIICKTLFQNYNQLHYWRKLPLYRRCRTDSSKCQRWAAIFLWNARDGLRYFSGMPGMGCDISMEC